MFHWFKPVPSPVLGMDITASSIKILELSCIQNQWNCVHFACDSLLPYSYDQSTNDHSLLIDRIKKIMANSVFNSNKVAVAMPDAAVMSKTVSFDSNLSDRELESLVALEASRYISHPEQDIHLDFEIQGQSLHDSKLIDVLIVASRAEQVNNKIALLAQAGLEVVVVDVASYAVERAAALLIDEGFDGVFAVLEVHVDVIRLFVLRQKNLIFSREEPLVELTEHYPWLLDNAMNEGISHDDEFIVLRAQRIIQFFYSMNSFVIDHVFLAGDWAKQAQASAIMHQKLNIPCSSANPLASMCFSPHLDVDFVMREAPALVSVCGLAMRTEYA